MQHTFSKKNIFIWGTGRNCNSFLSKYGLYLSSPLKDFQEEWENRFVGFIDILSDKNGTSFLGKRVIAPKEAIKEMDYCIITVANNASILRYLKENGFVEGQWVLWTDYLEECKKKALQYKQIILNQQNGKLASLMKIYDMLEMNRFNELQAVKKSDIIASLEWYYSNDIATAQSFVEKHLSFVGIRNTIKTIGIVIDRLYGGGIEKVVSLLLEGFEREGYNIVLLTDPSSEGCKKYGKTDIVHFTEKGGNFALSRLEDLETAICKYNIDVLCFHTGYARADTYYEIALAKMLGIFVTMEIHTAFIALLKDQIDVSSQFVYMYRLVDRLITVSETDNFFWKCMGCKSVLIENPIETFGVSEKVERTKDKEYFEIVWIGRIVQQPKRVLDAVDVIKLVHESLKNVRLHIIGMKDNDEVYRQLLDRITDIKEYVVIDEFQTDIQSVYQNADVVLMTSASESFSNVLAEAKVFARPVVMYELPWLRLSNDNTGVWSVKQRDLSSAAEAIICLLQDEKLWEKYSDDAWTSIQSDMNRDVTKEWMNIFDGLKEGVDVDDEQDIGMCNAIRLLLDQMYGKGYPDYQFNKGWLI